MPRSDDTKNDHVSGEDATVAPVSEVDATIAPTPAASDSRAPVSAVDATFASHTSPEVAPHAMAHPAELTGTPGRYVIEREFARGGMGRIVVAREQQLGRRVAVKELLTVDATTTGRFEREALITARLQHPSIVPLYEAGRTSEGLPFYAMKLVSGRALDAVLLERRTLPERLALLPNLVAVADALAYAHGERVIHRDLKPANVLVGSYGETVVIDWGLAKVLDEPDDTPTLPNASPPVHSDSIGASSVETRVGAVMGTPAYMPPEQARAEIVDQRADVYALGAILYELLAGHAPYRADTALGVLTAVVTGPPAPLSREAPLAPRDLVAIAEKAMARAPVDRYGDASELVADLRRFTTGQLVGAHQYSSWQLMGRFIARHRAVVSLSAAFAIVLGVASTIAVRRILDERARAVAAQHKAEQRSDALILEHARASLESDPSRALAWLKLHPPTAAAQVIAADAESHGVARVHLTGATDELQFLAVTPDGRTIVACSLDDRQLHVWDIASRAHRTLPSADGVIVLALSADGSRVATLSPTNVMITRLDGSPPVMLPVPPVAKGDHIRRLRWAPDGRHIVGRSEHGGLVLWDVAAHSLLPVLAAPADVEVTWSALAFSHDGARLAFSEPLSSDLHVRTVDGGADTILHGHGGAIQAAEFSPDSTLLVSAALDRSVRVWDLAAGTSRVLAVPAEFARKLAFIGPRRIVAVTNTGVLLAWNLEGDAMATGPAVAGDDIDLDASPESGVAEAFGDRSVVLWRVASDERRSLIVPEDAAATILLPSGGVVVSAGRTVLLFDDPFVIHRHCAAGSKVHEPFIDPAGRFVIARRRRGRSCAGISRRRPAPSFASRACPSARWRWRVTARSRRWAVTPRCDCATTRATCSRSSPREASRSTWSPSSRGSERS